MANRYWVCVNFHQRHCNFLDTFILILIPLRSHTHTNALSPSNRLNCCYIARNRVSLRPPASLLFILWPTRKISFCFCDQLIRIKLYDGHKRCENVRMPSLLPLNACWRCQCTRTTNIYIFQMSNHPISIYSFLFLFFSRLLLCAQFLLSLFNKAKYRECPTLATRKVEHRRTTFYRSTLPASQQPAAIYLFRQTRPKTIIKEFLMLFPHKQDCGGKMRVASGRPNPQIAQV